MKFFTRVIAAAHTLGAIILGLMFVAIVGNVIVRSLGGSLVWVEELTGYAVVWATYLGLAYVLHERRHVNVDLLNERLPHRAKALLRIIGNDAACIVFSVLLTWKSIYLIKAAMQTNRHTPILDFPVYPLMTVLPLGMILFGLEALIDAIATAKSLTKANHSINT